MFHGRPVTIRLVFTNKFHVPDVSKQMSVFSSFDTRGNMFKQNAIGQRMTSFTLLLCFWDLYPSYPWQKYKNKMKPHACLLFRERMNSAYKNKGNLSIFMTYVHRKPWCEAWFITIKKERQRKAKTLHKFHESKSKLPIDIHLYPYPWLLCTWICIYVMHNHVKGNTGHSNRRPGVTA